ASITSITMKGSTCERLEFRMRFSDGAAMASGYARARRTPSMAVLLPAAPADAPGLGAVAGLWSMHPDPSKGFHMFRLAAPALIALGLAAPLQALDLNAMSAE